MNRRGAELHSALSGSTPTTKFDFTCLALQLRSSFEMGAARFGLMGTAPERPCDEVGGLDAPLCEFDGDAADFLHRPADQERRFAGRRGSVFLSGTALAR